MIKSSITASMILHILASGSSFARRLAEVAGIDSKHVYPFLKPWIRRGLVKVAKFFTMNVYSASEQLMKISREVLEQLEDIRRSARGKVTRRKILEEARKRFKERHGVEMDEDHELVLQIFIDQALNRSSPYIQIDPGRGETLPRVIAKSLRRYGKYLDEEKIIEILKNLELANIVYIDRRHYKARLDKSIYILK
ncbi:MAG: hypothetical protein QXY26_08355 [Ignisphaera sp.]